MVSRFPVDACIDTIQGYYTPRHCCYGYNEGAYPIVVHALLRTDELWAEALDARAAAGGGGGGGGYSK
jgi:hypothetical protein